MNKLSKVLITLTITMVVVLTVISIHQWYLTLTTQGVF